MNRSNTIYTEAFEHYKNIGLDPLPITYVNGHPRKSFKSQSMFSINQDALSTHVVCVDGGGIRMQLLAMAAAKAFPMASIA
jgi:hypothetical protein